MIQFTHVNPMPVSLKEDGLTVGAVNVAAVEVEVTITGLTPDVLRALLAGYDKQSAPKPARASRKSSVKAGAAAE